MFSGFIPKKGSVGPSITDADVTLAEEKIGFKLPYSYRRLLVDSQNGGSPNEPTVYSRFPTGWSEDHFVVTQINGLGGEMGIDGEYGSAYMVEEWGYPHVGLVFAQLDDPEEALMFDYRGTGSEPTVAYVNSDGESWVIAESFDAFLGMLQPVLPDEVGLF
ncbi:MAG: SMI1/KNR4 family protein [Propionibacteriaceae bacterium]